MASVDRFLSEPLLAGEAAERFHSSRARLGARHRSWRQNFPAFGVLLDSDGERARALAGNLATEAREIIGVWIAARDEVSQQGVPPVGDQIAWIEGFCAAWSRKVLASDTFEALEGTPRERFRATFDELMERYCQDAVSHVRGRPEGPGRSAGFAARLARPARALGKTLHSFFFPRLQR
jgi:hypothetical protein